jgi:Lon protease-like protein
MAEPFPLFPLDLVALPGELIPLHVFEERYRVMFARLRGGDGRFGIVWAAEDGLRDVGCACCIERVLQEHDDGRLDVLTCGQVPLRVAGSLSHDPFPAAPVELLTDDDEADDPSARGGAEQAYDALVAAVTGQPADAGALAGMSAYAMASTIELGLEVKQALLELRSERARLHLLGRILTETLERLGPTELAQARARSNGAIRF